MTLVCSIKPAEFISKAIERPNVDTKKTGNFSTGNSNFSVIISNVLQCLSLWKGLKLLLVKHGSCLKYFYDRTESVRILICQSGMPSHTFK